MAGERPRACWEIGEGVCGGGGGAWRRGGEAGRVEGRCRIKPRVSLWSARLHTNIAGPVGIDGGDVNRQTNDRGACLFSRLIIELERFE